MADAIKKLSEPRKTPAKKKEEPVRLGLEIQKPDMVTQFRQFTADMKKKMKAKFMETKEDLKKMNPFYTMNETVKKTFERK